MSNIEDYVNKQTRWKIRDKNDIYLRVEVISFLFRFRDDVEFLIKDDIKQLEYRSASRVGTSDLGKNRERLNAFIKDMKRRNM